MYRSTSLIVSLAAFTMVPRLLKKHRGENKPQLHGQNELRRFFLINSHECVQFLSCC